ncbi:MAG: LysR family transcriptional regulator [Synergistaceae bacterium]|nr:LysR family transcriptional regulator [Synergistaceae bacterium]
MDLKELESFIAIVENGSVSRAAAALGLSQPAVSKHLAHLEEAMAVDLLLRGRTRSVPTAEGLILLEAGKAVLAELRRATEEIHRSGGVLSGRVTVAAGSIPGEYVLPPLIRRFHERYPSVSVSLEALDSRAASEALVSRRVDLACLGEDRLPAGYVLRPFVADELVLARPAGAPPLPGGAVTLEEVCNLPLLGRIDGSASQSLWESALKKQGLTAREPTLRFKGTGALLRALKGAQAYAVVSRWAVAAEGVDFVPLDPPLTRTFYVAHGHILTRAAQALADFLVEAEEGFHDVDKTVHVSD